MRGNGHGFTLIELLVVVLIISILAAIALPQYRKAVIKSRFAAPVSNLKTLANAQYIYRLTHGAYTSNLNDLDVTAPALQYFGAPVAHIYADDAATKSHIEYKYTGGTNSWAVVFLHNQSIYCGAANSDTAGQNTCKWATGKTTCEPGFEAGYCNYLFD